ncbi:MAG: glycosyl hydrolase family 18 protein [Fimbriimonadales bacterium]
MRRLWKRRWFRILAYVSLAFVALATLDYWTYPMLAASPARKFAKGTDGIWIRYTWYFCEVQESEMRTNSRLLQDNGFKYLFFHVRSAGKSGGLIHDYMDRAKRLNKIVQEAAPKLERIAWIYVGNEAGAGSVDLSTPGTKEALVATAKRLLDEGGFDGIQWDYEICPDGDRDFIELLRMTREALPNGTFVGVCSPTNYGWPLAGFGWSAEYFREVAALCDQIALMIYDTGMVHPRLYASHVRRQAVVLRDALKGMDCRVLFGLASYGPGFRSHNPRAENLRIGIHATRRTLEDIDFPNFAGISIFADYTTDDDEWAEYHNEWR